jgi:hypothetical protein
LANFGVGIGTIAESVHKCRYDGGAVGDHHAKITCGDANIGCLLTKIISSEAKFGYTDAKFSCTVAKFTYALVEFSS